MNIKKQIASKSHRLLTGLLLSSMVIIFLSCATQAQVDPEPVESVNLTDEIPEITRMSDIPSWVFDSTPKEGNPCFVVFSTRRADRDEELEKALQLAAMEAAKFQGIYISVKELSQKGNANFGYAEDLFLDYREELAPNYLESLEMDRQIRTPEGTFIRFRFTGSTTDLNYQITNPHNPSWISAPPEIPGHLVVIGFVERHRNWWESFKAADESAMKQMAYALYGKVDNQFETIDQSTENRSRTGSLGTILMQGEGILKNVLILARWQDEKGNYYSLAAMPVN